MPEILIAPEATELNKDSLLRELQKIKDEIGKLKESHKDKLASTTFKDFELFENLVDLELETAEVYPAEVLAQKVEQLSKTLTTYQKTLSKRYLYE